MKYNYLLLGLKISLLNGLKCSSLSLECTASLWSIGIFTEAIYRWFRESRVQFSGVPISVPDTKARINLPCPTLQLLESLTMLSLWGNAACHLALLLNYLPMALFWNTGRFGMLLFGIIPFGSLFQATCILRATNGWLVLPILEKMESIS